MKLRRSFYESDTHTVAQTLLGCLLVSEIGGKTKKTAGIIVETEAYLGEKDLASHAFKRKSKRNEVMYGEAGTAYVYLVYGKHYLFNVVTEKVGTPGAVLIRALQPVLGIEFMRKRRASEDVTALTTGPGNLTQALGITGEHNRMDLTGNLVWIEPYTTGEIHSSPRIGVKDRQNLRFFIKGNKFVSRQYDSILED